MQGPRRAVPYIVCVVVGCVATVIVYSCITVFFSDSTTSEDRATNALARGTSLFRASLAKESALLDAIFEHESKFLRLAELHQLIERADERQLMRLARQASRRDSESERTLAHEVVFRRLSGIDPIRALELVNELSDPDDDHMIRAIFNEWFHSDLEAAVSHAKTLSKETRVLVMHELVQSQLSPSEEFERTTAEELKVFWYHRAWAAARLEFTYIADPKTEWQSIATAARADPQGTSWDQIERIAQSWVIEEGIGVISEISASLDGTEIQGGIVNNILIASVRLDPSAVVELAANLPGIDNARAVQGVLTEWTRISPDEAFQNASSHLESQRRRVQEQLVVDVWARSDPTTLLSQLASIPEDLRNRALRQALWDLVQRDPQITAEFLSEVDDAETRLDIARKLSQEWSSIDVDAALDWILSDAELASHTPTLGPALQALAKIDPELALQIALDQPVDSNAEGAETFVLVGVVEADIDDAIAMLPNLREGARPLSHKFIGFYLLLRGHTDRALEFGSNLPESYRKDYFIYLFGQWRQSDHRGLLDQLNHIKSDELRYYAAKVLDYENQRHGFLLDKDLSTVETIL